MSKLVAGRASLIKVQCREALYKRVHPRRFAGLNPVSTHLFSQDGVTGKALHSLSAFGSQGAAECKVRFLVPAVIMVLGWQYSGPPPTLCI